MKLVAFKIGNEEYAFDILQVLSIEKLLEITPVPHSSEFIKGMIELRGKIYPVIDLSMCLSNKEFHKSENTRIIMLKFNEITLGLIVDQATDVIDITDDMIQAPPMALTNGTSFISGVVKYEGRLLIIVKPDALMEDFPVSRDLQRVGTV
jgi:purine-binding chemotaxis protein CheW